MRFFSGEAENASHTGKWISHLRKNIKESDSALYGHAKRSDIPNKVILLGVIVCTHQDLFEFMRRRLSETEFKDTLDEARQELNLNRKKHSGAIEWLARIGYPDELVNSDEVLDGGGSSSTDPSGSNRI